MIFKKMFKAPVWCNTKLMSRKDVKEGIIDFYRNFDMTMRPGMARVVAKIESDPFYEPTLFDQVQLVRCLLADISSMQGAFDDELWQDIAVETAESLADANRYDRLEEDV